MDERSFNIRVPKRWVRVALIVCVTALIVAPLTAIASHSFTDVPDSNTFHEDIAWLADVGVTKGCNPPANTEFCPNDDVTRGQMSAFMRRFAQYIGAEDGTPAQADNAATAGDADTLDGKDSITLLSAAAVVNWDYTDGAGTSSTSPTALASMTVTAPAAGYLLVEVSGQMWYDADSSDPNISRTVPFDLGLCDSADSSADCDGTWLDHWTEHADNTAASNETVGVSKVRLIPVDSAGDVTLYLNGAAASGSDTLEIWDMYGTANYIPSELQTSVTILSTAGTGSGQGN